MNTRDVVTGRRLAVPMLVRDLPLLFDSQVTLTPITETPAPNDFRLCTSGCQFFAQIRAELVIDVLADGTIDVRGASDKWLNARAHSPWREPATRRSLHRLVDGHAATVQISPDWNHEP